MKKIILTWIISLTFLIIGCNGNHNSHENKNSLTLSCNAELIEDGKEALSEGNFTQAASSFLNAIKENENCGEAHWGLVISNIEKVVSNLNALLFTGQNFSPLNFSILGIETIISGIISTYELPLRTVVEHIKIIEKNDYTFQIDALPLTIGPISSPYIDLTLQGKFGLPEAEMIKSFSSLILGTIDFIFAHDFDISLSDFPSPSSRDASYNYFFYIRDGLPGIYKKYPNFLGKGFQWDERMPRVDNEYADAVTGFYSLLLALPGCDPAPGPQNSFILYEDTDGNGVDGGDVIGINVKEVRKFSLPVTDFSTPDDNPEFYRELLSHYSIPYPFTTKFMKYLYSFLDKLYNSLKAVDSNQPGETIHPYNLINSLVEGVGFITIPELPDFFALQPAKFFEPPRPVKEYLPQLIDFPGGFTTRKTPVYSFLIEVEYPGYTTPATEVAMFYPSDTTHFSAEYTLNGKYLSLLSIPPDCIYHSDSFSYYPYWQSPSFNGTLLLNVRNLSGGSCENDPEGWGEANNYTLNKVINGLGDYLSLENKINTPEK